MDVTNKQIQEEFASYNKSQLREISKQYSFSSNC